MNYPKRKNIRLSNYDYSNNGCYFITVCTQNKEPLFWANDNRFPPRLSESGKILKQWILKINEKYPTVLLDKFVIMPNHFHLLLTIDNSIDQDNTHSVNAVMGWLKYQATTEINRIQATPGKTIFQRSFHDHIIRDEHDYKLRWEYIDTNIDRWIDDDYFTGS